MSEPEYPPLPPIQGELLLNIFTHKSLRMTDASVDNERYATVGEKVFEAEITRYIFTRYPKYDRQAIEEARLALLSDSNYAAWVTHYKMREKLRFNPSAIEEVQSADGIREIFHAYVGGLYCQENGQMIVKSWVFDLVAPPEERKDRDMMSYSPPPGALPPIDYYSTYSHNAHSQSSISLQAYHDIPAYDPPPHLATNSSLPPPQPAKTHIAFLPRFNEAAMKRHLDVHWQAEQVGLQHSPRWNVVCLVNGRACGNGSATTKQLAKEEAAKQAFLALGISD